MAAQATKEVTTLQKPIIILDQCATRSEAKRIATVNGSRLISVKEFILAIKDPTQYKRLEGRRYWTADYGLKLSGYCKIDYENGTIVKVSESEWEKLTREQRAYAYGGSGPVILSLDYDYGGLVVDVVTWPNGVAQVAYVEGKTSQTLLRNSIQG